MLSKDITFAGMLHIIPVQLYDWKWKLRSPTCQNTLLFVAPSCCIICIILGERILPNVFKKGNKKNPPKLKL